MEFSNSLLVAMMFVTILSMGIGNVLMALPPLIDRQSHVNVGRLQLAWIVLLLLLHLDLFWQVRVILEREAWSFVEFVFTETGPILLLLATSFLLPDPSREADDPFDHYRAAAPLSFTLLAVMMLWIPALDLYFGGALQPENALDVALAALFGLLAVARSARLHVAGTAIAWIVFVCGVGVRAVEIGG